jgi:carbon starvation protein CstA
MGLMLLVLMPVPYVDASSANVLKSRWARARIGAAGMLVELFIAALAFYAWMLVEPGLLRACASTSCSSRGCRRSSSTATRCCVTTRTTSSPT